MFKKKKYGNHLYYHNLLIEKSSFEQSNNILLCYLLSYFKILLPDSHQNYTLLKDCDSLGLKETICSGKGVK